MPSMDNKMDQLSVAGLLEIHTKPILEFLLENICNMYIYIIFFVHVCIYDIWIYFGIYVYYI